MRVGLDGMLLGGYHSGVEQSIEGLIRALPQVAPEHEFLLACRPEYAAHSPVPTLPAPGWAGGRLLRIAYEQTRLAHDLRDCDLLHAPGYIMPLNWHGPSVLTVYDVIALQHPELCKRSNVWHFGMMLPRSLRRATAIIVPTETVAQAVREVAPEVGEKLRVIPLGVDERFRPAAEAEVARVRQAHGLTEPYLLCVGNIEPKKNLAAVLRAFDAVAGELPHQLVIVGRRAWKCEAFDRALAGMAHRERVHLLGYAAGGDLAALYTGAALLVQWSLVEGMGLPPLEAMACGTPALVSDGGALPEVAGPAAEVVPLGPPQRLAEGLLHVLRDDARLVQLRAAGLQHAAQYTWERHARAVAALYEELLHAQS
ncbi:MAG: glycosyltransferase family 4 protein [Armatimonadetes bacterium]|nr:glycosyltransferase family 4 protein [Armatimonadota bacterium]